MANSRLTYKETINYFMANVEKTSENEAFFDRMNDLLKSLDKKSNGSRKETAKQKENNALRAKILEVLALAEKPMTCKELIKALGFTLEECSTARMGQLLRPMVGEKIVKDYDGKTPIYSLA